MIFDIFILHRAVNLIINAVDNATQIIFAVLKETFQSLSVFRLLDLFGVGAADRGDLIGIGDAAF